MTLVADAGVLTVRLDVLPEGLRPAGRAAGLTGRVVIQARERTDRARVIPHRDHHDRHHGDDRPHAEQFHHSADREKIRRSGPSRFH